MINLKIDWPMRGHDYTEDEITAVNNVMRSSDKALTQGFFVQQFEKDLAKYVGVEQMHATMSCAHSLDLCTMLIEINLDDEIIIPAHTYCATAIAFARRGAKIVWGDIDSRFLTLSPESIKKLITKKTKAIVLVHLYGLISPQINEIVDLCSKNNIILIEDCAQSLGAFYDNKSCGTFGDIACFSFHAQKNLTTLGEGGAITVKNKGLSELIPALRLNGHTKFQNQGEYYWLPAMTNVEMQIQNTYPIKSTMNESQGAVGSLLLKRLNSLTDERRKRALHYRKELEEYPEILFQAYETETSHSHHLLPVKIKSKKFNRDDLIKKLYDKYAIKAIIQYYPLNRYDLFKNMGHLEGELKSTNEYFDNMMSIPFSTIQSWDQIEYIISSIKYSIDELK
jgi:perosamine synthetase